MACAKINFHSKARALHAFTELLYIAIHSFLLYYTQETKTQKQTLLVKKQHQQQHILQTHSHLLKSIQFNSNPFLPSVTYRKQPRPIAFDSIRSKKIREILKSTDSDKKRICTYQTAFVLLNIVNRNRIHIILPHLEQSTAIDRNQSLSTAINRNPPQSTAIHRNPPQSTAIYCNQP